MNSTFSRVPDQSRPVQQLVHSFYGAVFRVWRRDRLRQLFDRLKPDARTVILDVGGMAHCWRDFPGPLGRVDVLNTHAAVGSATDAHCEMRAIVGDGCALPFSDRSYSLVFSNSVIEHVGSWDRQRAFAAEARRVGAALWVQTPAWEFPFEPHFLAPFVHYVPAPLRGFVARWLTPRGWIDRAGTEELLVGDGVRLLSKREMHDLFPDCEILVERFLGVFPKSYVATRAGLPLVAPQTQSLR